MTYQMRGFVLCAWCNERSASTRKLCRRCYYRAYRQNRLDEFPINGPADVFEFRIKKTKSCWLWTGTKNAYGYGIFLMPGEVPVRAHRYSYEYFVGPIPNGKIIMHTCDNPPCVNPAHLRIGTRADNNRDCFEKKRRPMGKDAWNGRLSTRQVSAIRNSTKTQAELARKYGVHQSHICRIRKGAARMYD